MHPVSFALIHIRADDLFDRFNEHSCNLNIYTLIADGERRLHTPSFDHLPRRAVIMHPDIPV